MGASDAIVQGFRELLDILPYDKIAVYQICEKAGVSRKTFYVHFQNKASIVNKIVYDDIIAPLVKMNEGIARCHRQQQHGFNAAVRSQ